jgi:CheY-like chemotaxis protein
LAQPDQSAEDGRKRVLIVEDNRDSAEMLSEVLGTDGCSTRIAYNGPAALDTARAFKPGIAIIDINLPLMDGYELARAIRELPGLRSIKLIALTGHSEPAHRRMAQQAGFDVLMVKPVDLARLRSVIAA